MNEVINVQSTSVHSPKPEDQQWDTQFIPHVIQSKFHSLEKQLFFFTQKLKFCFIESVFVFTYHLSMNNFDSIINWMWIIIHSTDLNCADWMEKCLRFCRVCGERNDWRWYIQRRFNMNTKDLISVRDGNTDQRWSRQWPNITLKLWWALTSRLRKTFWILCTWFTTEI